MARDTTADGVHVAAGVFIPAGDFDVRATKSGGPGGQHVNTSSTRVEVTWRLTTSSAVSDEQRGRIARKLAARLDANGDLRVVASDTRSQRQNRLLAEQRLAKLVAGALVVPKARRKTRPSKAAVERRLTEKRHHAERKASRRGTDGDA